jgi:hypothetical protein
MADISPSPTSKIESPPRDGQNSDNRPARKFVKSQPAPRGPSAPPVDALGIEEMDKDEQHHLDERA